MFIALEVKLDTIRDIDMTGRKVIDGKKATLQTPILGGLVWWLVLDKLGARLALWCISRFVCAYFYWCNSWYVDLQENHTV